MKVAVIGAGASGLVCAISLASEAKVNNLPVEVFLFESKDKPGKKLLATGNGRCNLMNKNEGDFYFDKNGFSSFALKKYDVRSNLLFFESLGLYTRSDDEGRIYPLSNQASSVLDALRFACEGLGVRIIAEHPIEAIRLKDGRFLLNGKNCFDKVVLACGGKAGVKGFNGYELLGQIGHKVVAPAPSLTKLEVEDKKTVRQLKGIRQKGVFTLFEGKDKFACEKGELLFTDYGLSGIAVMQLSAYAVRCKGKMSIVADFVDEMSFADLTAAVRKYARSSSLLKNENLLSGFVPKRLGEAVMKNLSFPLNACASELTDDDIKAIAAKLKKFTFNISGVRGFEDAQVTAGGADTTFFNNKTMESLRVKGLYCIGELLDVDGLCGGYNLHWAWSSGRLCAESIIKDLKNRKG